MSRLNRLIVPMRRELGSSVNRAIWEEARIRHPVFRKHPSVESALELMADQARKVFAEKDILTQAFIVEHKHSNHPFWASVLIIAYSPMLGRLRKRIYGKAMSSDDLDQLVVFTFLSVVGSFSFRKRRCRTAMTLRQNTQRAVFRALRKRQKEQAEQRQLEDLSRLIQGFDPFDELRDNDRLHLDAGQMTRLLIRATDGIIQRSNLDVVIATYLHGESVKAYAERMCATADGDSMGRAYQRIKRQRLRTMQQLKRLFENFYCPFPDSAMLCSTEEDDADEQRIAEPLDYWTAEVFQ